MAKYNVNGEQFPIKAYLKADSFSQQFVRRNEKGQDKELVTHEMFWGEELNKGLYLDYTFIKNRKIEITEGISHRHGLQTFYEEESDNWLQKNIFNLYESKVFVIRGYAGCGKTTFMNKLLLHRKIDKDAFYIDIGKDWAYPLECSMFFNETLNAFDRYIEKVIKNESTREEVWEKFIEMGSDLDIQRFDLQVPNIISELQERKEKLNWNKLRVNLRGYLYDEFGNTSAKSIDINTKGNERIWHNWGQTQTIISLLVLMICANFLVENKRNIASKSFLIIFDNVDVITDPVLSAENVVILWGVIHRFIDYKFLYRRKNQQELPDFGIFIAVRKVLYSHITSQLPDLEMQTSYNPYYINVCDISDLYLSQDILNHRISFWTKYINDKKVRNKLKLLEEITTVHDKTSLFDYKVNDNYKDIFEIQSSINLDAFFNHNYRALANVLSIFLEDRKYTQIFLADFNSRKHSKNWQKVSTLIFLISLLYKNSRVWNKMGFGCEDSSLIDYPTTLNRLILNYLYLAKCGQVLYPYLSERNNVPFDENVSLREIISLLDKVKFISIDKSYNEEQISRKYNAADPLLLKSLIAERLADMCARNAKVYNTYAYGYDPDDDELWRRPLYFVDGVKLNQTAASDKKLKLYFEQSIKNDKDDQIFFSITDEGFVLIQDIVASFEFYSARYCKSLNAKPLHQVKTKNELENLIKPVYNALKLCCIRHNFFMNQYIERYNIDLNKYLKQNFHPRTKPRFENKNHVEEKLSDFSFRPQLHIVRVIYAHIGYFNNVKELFSRSHIEENEIKCKCLTGWIENYLALYKKYFYDLLKNTECNSDNNVYDDLYKKLKEQKGQYMISGDHKNINIGKEDRYKGGDLSNSGIFININGGKINLAKDNNTINPNRKDGVNANELDKIIKEIMSNLSTLKKENADEIADIVEMAKNELEKSEPKASRLRNCLTLIAPMYKIANRIPPLVDGLQRLQDFVSLYTQ